MRVLGLHLISAGEDTYEKIVARYLRRNDAVGARVFDPRGQRQSVPLHVSGRSSGTNQMVRVGFNGMECRWPRGSDIRAPLPTASFRLREHRPTGKVRVICISGKYLFCATETPNHVASPLHELALKGGLEVVMPESDAGNPTVASRFQTYSEAFRQMRRFER